MKVVIPDDYQDAIRTLDCFKKLNGLDVTIYHDTVKDIDTLAQRFQEADALVLIRERTAIGEALLARLPKLKLICQTGRGIPHIDVPACTRHGVGVAVGGGSPSFATAELTWALVLASVRHIPQEVAGMQAGKWQTTLGLSLHGRTLGIYGYGKIGSMVANYGRAFGMQVLVWGRAGSLARARDDGFGAADSKADLFQRADVLSLHVPLNAETHGIVSATDLALMQPSSLLVNTSRAGLIAQGALEQALLNGRPGSAAVDVYAEEPLKDHPLLHMHNVICTPHIGYVEKDSYETFFAKAFDQLATFAAGQSVEIINPADTPF